MGIVASSSPTSTPLIPSPLTRLQARRERDHPHHASTRKGKSSSALSVRDRERLSLGSVLSGTTPGEGVLLTSEGGLKRRWSTTPAVTALHDTATAAITLDDDGESSMSDRNLRIDFDFTNTALTGEEVSVFGAVDDEMGDVVEVATKRRKL